VGDVRSSAGFGGCLGDVTLTTGDVGATLYVQGINTSARVTTGVIGYSVEVGSYFVNTTNQLIADVQTQGFNHLNIRSTIDSTINIQGSIERNSANPTSVLFIGANTGLTLGPLTGSAINALTITSNSFASPPSITVGAIVHPGGTISSPDGSVTIQNNGGLSLGGISMGSIDGNLRITDNDGFSNNDAADFAAARTVGGTVSVSGNTP
jgi:hypothetical protein